MLMVKGELYTNNRQPKDIYVALDENNLYVLVGSGPSENQVFDTKDYWREAYLVPLKNKDLLNESFTQE